MKISQRTVYLYLVKNDKNAKTTLLGIEPRISGSVDQRLIHWATESSCWSVYIYIYIFFFSELEKKKTHKMHLMTTLIMKYF